MAAATTTPNPPKQETARTESHRSLSLRNPLPLSASQEQEVRNIYYRRVRDHCAPEIKEFAACAVGRTITTSFFCRRERQAMNSCMISHSGVAQEDLAREEWFQGRDDRQRKRQEELDAVERRREVVKTVQKTWEQREEERLAREKALGGAGGIQMAQGGGGGGGQERIGRTGRWESGEGQERGRTWR